MGSGVPTATGVETDGLARQITTKMSTGSFGRVRVALERAATAQAMALEKGMIAHRSVKQIIKHTPRRSGSKSS
ncbi:hypothetical protein SBV1_2300029 [Verrucomicrobia bacterium]|nr:hypothetical protein SBV1_2300029 [Verrucomicrobiota bacterium]